MQPTPMLGEGSTEEIALYSRHTYYGTPKDKDAVAAIREKYGLGSDSEAIRFALRLVAKGLIHITIERTALEMGYQAR